MADNTLFLSVIIIHRDATFKMSQNREKPLRIVYEHIFVHHKHIRVIAISCIIKLLNSRFIIRIKLFDNLQGSQIVLNM